MGVNAKRLLMVLSAMASVIGNGGDDGFPEFPNGSRGDAEGAEKKSSRDWQMPDLRWVDKPQCSGTGKALDFYKKRRGRREQQVASRRRNRSAARRYYGGLVRSGAV